MDETKVDATFWRKVCNTRWLSTAKHRGRRQCNLAGRIAPLKSLVREGNFNCMRDWVKLVYPTSRESYVTDSKVQGAARTLHTGGVRMTQRRQK